MNSSKVQTSMTIHIHGITIEPPKWRAFVKDNPLSLTPYQFRLLKLLASNAGRVYSRHEIIERLHETESEVTEHSVTSEIMLLRKKLGDHGHLIKTIKGVGYAFKA